MSERRSTDRAIQQMKLEQMLFSAGASESAARLLTAEALGIPDSAQHYRRQSDALGEAFARPAPRAYEASQPNVRG